MALMNLKVKGHISTITIDIGRFKTSLVKQCEVQNRQAVRAWLRETLKFIPTYTGTARGTFKPLGRTLRVAVPKIGQAGFPGNKKRAAKKKTIWYGPGRTFTAGFEAGGQYAQYDLKVRQSGLKITCTFNFTNNLPYVAYNDINGAPPNFILPSNPPWQSHDAGAKAWKQYILTTVPERLKIPREAIKITVMKVR